MQTKVHVGAAELFIIVSGKDMFPQTFESIGRFSLKLNAFFNTDK